MFVHMFMQVHVCACSSNACFIVRHCHIASHSSTAITPYASIIRKYRVHCPVPILRLFVAVCNAAVCNQLHNTLAAHNMHIYHLLASSFFHTTISHFFSFDFAIRCERTHTHPPTGAQTDTYRPHVSGNKTHLRALKHRL